jgi:hypothetical protein
MLEPTLQAFCDHIGAVTELTEIEHAFNSSDEFRRYFREDLPTRRNPIVPIEDRDAVDAEL